MNFLDLTNISYMPEVLGPYWELLVAISRKSKFVETENRMEDTRGVMERRTESYCSMNTEF